MAVLPPQTRARWRRRLSASTIVLLYHRVLPRIGRDINRLAVGCENFAGQMAWLAEHARVVGETGFLDMLERRPLSRKPSVLVTFDDGYADNVEHALPILRRFGHFAILFVTSAAVGNDRLFWWDALERIITRGIYDADGAGKRVGAFALLDGSAVPCGAGFDAGYAELHRVLKPYDDERRCEALAGLARQFGVDLRSDATSRAVTPDELRAWRAAGMSVGAHTRTHAQLSALNDDDIWQEVAVSKHELERLSGAPVLTFAYPFGGRGDFDGRAEKAVREAGYHCAFANWAGSVRWARSHYRLPRYLVRNWSTDEFAAKFEEWCR